MDRPEPTTVVLSDEEYEKLCEPVMGTLFTAFESMLVMHAGNTVAHTMASVLQIIAKGLSAGLLPDLVDIMRDWVEDYPDIFDPSDKSIDKIMANYYDKMRDKLASS